MITREFEGSRGLEMDYSGCRAELKLSDWMARVRPQFILVGTIRLRALGSPLVPGDLKACTM